MIPLRDHNRSERFPIVTITLIALNVLAFLWELGAGENLRAVFIRFGVVPARYTVAEIARHFSLADQAAPFVTSLFLHGGWLHLLGNMWSLWIFGDNVEDRLGRARYLALYLGGGLAAALLHIFTNLHSTLPTIGASGALAAVMGAYFRLFPRARIEAVIPPLFLGPIFVLPAVVFLGFWFALQLFSGTLSLGGGARHFGGIAWWAHVGGFVFGLVVGSSVRQESRRGGREWE